MRRHPVQRATDIEKMSGVIAKRKHAQDQRCLAVQLRVKEASLQSGGDLLGLVLDRFRQSISQFAKRLLVLPCSTCGREPEPGGDFSSQFLVGLGGPN